MSKRRTTCGRIVLVFVILAIFGVHSALAFAANEAEIKEVKEKLIIANKILDMENLARPLGDISVRIPGTDTFLITRSVAPGMATPDDIVVCNLDGKVIQGKYNRTFGEVAAHSLTELG